MVERRHLSKHRKAGADCLFRIVLGRFRITEIAQDAIVHRPRNHAPESPNHLLAKLLVAWQQQCQVLGVERCRHPARTGPQICSPHPEQSRSGAASGAPVRSCAAAGSPKHRYCGRRRRTRGRPLRPADDPGSAPGPERAGRPAVGQIPPGATGRPGHRGRSLCAPRYRRRNPQNPRTRKLRAWACTAPPSLLSQTAVAA